MATVTDPSDGSAVSSTDVTLHGYARFSGTGTKAVAVTVDATTVQATLDDPTAAFSAWSAPIALPSGEGSKTVTVTPSVGGTQGTVTTLHLTLDTTAPTLSVATPAAGSVVSNTLTFAGTTSDAAAGLLRVEVSMDGGYTWRRAVLDNGAWSLGWDVPLHQDYATYPAQVRAVDRAGNITVVANPVAEDNVPPTDLAPVTFSEPVGQHVDGPWIESDDAHGLVAETGGWQRHGSRGRPAGLQPGRFPHDLPRERQRYQHSDRTQRRQRYISALLDTYGHDRRSGQRVAHHLRPLARARPDQHLLRMAAPVDHP